MGLIGTKNPFIYIIGWGIPQPVSAYSVDGMRHVGFRVLLVLYHYLCYKNDVILYDQSRSYPVVSILRNEFQALSLTKLYGLN